MGQSFIKASGAALWALSLPALCPGLGGALQWVGDGWGARCLYPARAATAPTAPNAISIAGVEESIADQNAPTATQMAAEVQAAAMAAAPAGDFAGGSVPASDRQPRRQAAARI